MYSCPSCGRQLVSVRKFCRYCSAPLPGPSEPIGLPATCPRCAIRNKPGSNFCKNCGAPLNSQPTQSAPRPAPEVMPTLRRDHDEIATAVGKSAPEFTGVLPKPASRLSTRLPAKWLGAAIIAVGGIAVLLLVVWPYFARQRAEYLTEPFSVQASSTLDPQGTNSYCPKNTLDGRPDTAWVEGVRGPGIGEWISFRFAPQVITYIDIYPGYGKSRESFSRNNRVNKATLVFSDGTRVQARFVDEMRTQTISLASPLRTSSLVLIIDDVYRGSRYDDTCISEINWH